MPLSPGKALFWPHVYRTKPGYGPVPLALGRPIRRQAYWFVVSDEPTDEKTFEEDGRRFDSAEHCLDDQSTGFQLESSLMRSANARERLCGVLAITTLDLGAQGTAVVAHGTRRWVDAHGCRGPSSLNIGWNGVKLARSRGDALIPHWHLSAAADPAPAMASKIQPQKPPQLFFALEFEDAVA
jgi:hypothetical protein